jgi:hypothetical protein
MRRAKYEKETAKKAHIRQGEERARLKSLANRSQEKRERIPTKSLQNQAKLQPRENRLPSFLEFLIMLIINCACLTVHFFIIKTIKINVSNKNNLL